MHRHLPVLFVLIFLLPTLVLAADRGPKILILNSYHKGYSWSDQMLSSIESSILLAYPEADIRVEFMDTKRQSGQPYLDILATFYKEKFNDQPFDLIFACDDHAIEFLLDSADTLFPETPVVFSGANRIDTSKILTRKNFTGVLEYADIKKTLAIARTFQPDARKLVVINDNTVTGRYVAMELENLLASLPEDLELTQLQGLPLTELTTALGSLDGDTIVLLLVYLRDDNGVYYDPTVSAAAIGKSCPVPVYGVWDFYFDHGIIGGAMTSGYLQGEKAAELGLKILAGEAPANIPVITDGANQLLFDHRQLSRFHLPMEKLPKEAIIKNLTFSDQQSVLLLHSYSPDNPWTREVIRGTTEEFAASGLGLLTFTEFMDTKRHTDKPYLNMLSQLFYAKYAGKEIDLVLTSDDNSFNFVRSQRTRLFKDIPVVFCGVNYLPEPQSVRSDAMTGVMESYDILGTIRLGLELFPKTDTLFIINDDTTTGRSNVMRFNQIRDQLPRDLNLVFSGDSSMQQVRKQVAELGENALVLLMSFTLDKDNYRFSFQDSARLISESSSRPVLGFWDFYLGYGIIGGVITSGYDQGRTAGKLATAILNGTTTATLPVVEESPVVATVDFEVASRYGVDTEAIRKHVRLFNRPVPFIEQYRKVVLTTLVVFTLLLALILIQAGRIILEKRRHRQLAVKVELDPMTGAYSREYFTTHIEGITRQATRQQRPLTICYFDLDNLKKINDAYGHMAGDDYIRLAVQAIRRHIRSDDLLCRMGGDEFIAVLHNCTRQKGARLCGLARDYLAEQQRRLQLDWQTGISCGFAELDPHRPASVEELIEEADKEMYSNKMARKNSSPL